MKVTQFEDPIFDEEGNFLGKQTLYKAKAYDALGRAVSTTGRNLPCVVAKTLGKVAIACFETEEEGEEYIEEVDA